MSITESKIVIDDFPTADEMSCKFELIDKEKYKDKIAEIKIKILESKKRYVDIEELLDDYVLKYLARKRYSVDKLCEKDPKNHYGYRIQW